MTEDAFPSIVRVCRADGTGVGAGFLAAPNLVMTCAHVVADAGSPLLVEFPLLSDSAPIPAEVISLRPPLADDTGDTALLAVKAPPGALPALLGRGGEWDDEVRIFGFPSEHGVWVSARLKAKQGAGWVQMESAPGYPAIEPGFSGSPVWSPRLQAVIGMTVASHTGATTAYLIPIDSVIEAHPELSRTGQSPFRGLEPFLEEHADIFFGREDDVARLTALVSSQPVVVVSGPSGSGKSSLVRAGLLPRLNETVVRFRPDPVLRPASILAAVLVPLLEPSLSEVDMLVEKEKLAARLTSPDFIALLSARLAERFPSGLLVFADQFEEIAASDPAAARTLFSLLISLAPAVRTVLTLRSASLDSLLTSATASAFNDGIMWLAPMDRSSLYAAVTGALTPAAFEAGLVDRVLDDAGHNRLPLVQFALTQLWESGRLTHAAYDELGGVSGALVRYADEIYLRLPAAEQALARRLFIQLAAPDEDGFSRRSARIADLDPALQPIIAKLASDRLIVLDHAVDGVEIVDIVHQALIQQWERLREWLAEDREFRSWQEQLRHRLGHDLLRGDALTRAQHWLGERPDDIPEPQRTFVQDSTYRQRRDVRVRWMVTAVIAVFALLASVLAIITLNANAENERQLHTQASHLLGQESLRQAATNPTAALQLALSAWHNDKATPEAYEALLNQNLAMGSMTKINRGLFRGDLRSWTATPDGRVIATLSIDPGGGNKLSVWHGLLDGNPEEWVASQLSSLESFALSPDGTKIAVATGVNGLRVLDTENHMTARTVVLRPARQVKPIYSKLSFSSDGLRLFDQRTTSSTSSKTSVSVWDMARRNVISALELPGAGRYDLGPEPGTLVVSEGASGPTQVIDAMTGGKVHELPAGSRAVRNAASVHACDNDTGLRVWDTRTGAEQWATPGQNCGLEVDATDRYLITKTSSRSSGFQLIALTDTTDGRRYQVRVPMSASPTSSQSPRLIVAASQNDSVTVLAVADKSVLTLRGIKPAMTVDDVDFVSPDGRYGASITPGIPVLILVDLLTGKEMGRLSGVRSTGNWFTFTADGHHLVATHDYGLGVFSVPELREETRINAGEYTRDQTCDPILLATQASELAVACGQTVHRWNLSTGAKIGVPIAPWRSPRAISARPLHPGQLLVAFDQGVQVMGLTGEVGWVILVDAIGGITTPAVADPTGTKIAIYTNNQTIEVRGIDDRRELGTIKLSERIGYIIGFGRDDTLITQLDEVVNVWRIGDGRLLATASLPGPTPARLHGDTLTYYGGNGPFSISLDPNVWFKDLCRVADREVTQDEKRLYPSGALEDRPCQ